MTYIYIDESGYLGISKNGNKFFVISCVKIKDEINHKRFSRIPKDIRQKTLKKKVITQPELKFSNSSPLIRERFLYRVAKLDLEIFTLVIEKKYIDQKLQNNLPILYNYLIKVLLESVLNELPKNQELHICLDKSMSANQRENFESYVKTEFLAIFKQLPTLEIVHAPSSCNSCLQVVDFICGAFGYKYNTMNLKNDAEHYVTIIAKNIKLEKNDFFKEKRTLLTRPDLNPEASSFQQDLLVKKG
jgi:hypothetical protein